MTALVHILVLLTALLSSPSFASPTCTKWPDIRFGWGPAWASTGLPLTYNIRLACEARGAFEVKQIHGKYVSEEKDPIAPATPVYKAQLRNNEVLYQTIFIVSDGQAPGIYKMNGCVEIEDLATGEVRCTELPPSPMEIVFVPKD